MTTASARTRPMSLEDSRLVRRLLKECKAAWRRGDELTAERRVMAIKALEDVNPNASAYAGWLSLTQRCRYEDLDERPDQVRPTRREAIQWMEETVANPDASESNIKRLAGAYRSEWRFNEAAALYYKARERCTSRYTYFDNEIRRMCGFGEDE